MKPVVARPKSHCRFLRWQHRPLCYHWASLRRRINPGIHTSLQWELKKGPEGIWYKRFYFEGTRSNMKLISRLGDI